MRYLRIKSTSPSKSTVLVQHKIASWPAFFYFTLRTVRVVLLYHPVYHREYLASGTRTEAVSPTDCLPPLLCARRTRESMASKYAAAAEGDNIKGEAAGPGVVPGASSGTNPGGRSTKIGHPTGGSHHSRFADHGTKLDADSRVAMGYKDPLPTTVPKKSKKKKDKPSSPTRKKGKKEITWGEEAHLLSEMVRQKYGVHSADGSAPGDAAEDINQNQQKLLYLIHQYSFASMAHPEQECWIRRIPVLVLLYEGIVSQIFDYDYAPSLEVFQANRVYLNITQEGKDDIDDLREGGYIEALTLASSEYDQCLAYTTKRSRSDPVLAKMKAEWKDEVDTLLLAPNSHKSRTAGASSSSSSWSRDERLLEVFWNAEEQEFEIVSHSGYSRKSTITDVEDVSYVCSPCIPACLRKGWIPPPVGEQKSEEVNGGGGGKGGSGTYAMLRNTEVSAAHTHTKRVSLNGNPVLSLSLSRTRTYFHQHCPFALPDCQTRGEFHQIAHFRQHPRRAGRSAEGQRCANLRD